MSEPTRKLKRVAIFDVLIAGSVVAVLAVSAAYAAHAFAENAARAEAWQQEITGAVAACGDAPTAVAALDKLGSKRIVIGATREVAVATATGAVLLDVERFDDGIAVSDQYTGDELCSTAQE